MIIDEITLQNFGVYKGRQSMLTTPPSASKPITLIGGLNGGGKTTLLDAIHLVLYGRHAKLAGRGQRSYGKYLQSMIHRGVDTAEDVSVEMKFRRVIDGETQQFEVIRSWKSKSNGEANEKVSVFLNGEDDQALAENWYEHMDAILPIQMAHLFFFDGEQIADLADPEKAKTLLKTGVHALLGLDLVERLQEDLLVLERRKKLEAIPAYDQHELRSLEQSLENVERELEGLHQKRGQIKTDVERAAKTRDEAVTKFKKKGGDLFEQQESLELEKGELDVHIEEVESTIRELAAGAAPLSLVENLLLEVKTQAEYEIEAEKNRVVAGLLRKRDNELISNLKENKVPATHIKTVQKSLEQDRANRPIVDPASCYLGADESLIQQIDDLTRHELPDVVKQMKAARTELDELQEKLRRAERKLARVPEADVIAKLKLALDIASKGLQDLESQHCEISHEWDVLLQKKEFIEVHRNKIYNEQLNLNLQEENSQRVIDHMPRVRNTLNGFRERVIQKHLSKIENLILESFQQLLRKTRLVKTIRINPDNYEIILIGADGEQLAFDRLSAGERQLLATAMLWGMVKASGRPLPLIIDTPLGRLDSVHRELLTKHYFPVASHQVFLLSTDEEIDDALFGSLKSRVGNGYMLEHDDVEQRTNMTKGYRWPSNSKV
jgi:DNA sulfur modification protein DndD